MRCMDSTVIVGRGRFRMLRPRMHRPPVAAVRVRFDVPSPKMPPEDAARLRSSYYGMSAWEIERINRRY